MHSTVLSNRMPDNGNMACLFIAHARQSPWLRSAGAAAGASAPASASASAHYFSPLSCAEHRRVRIGCPGSTLHTPARPHSHAIVILMAPTFV